MQGARQSISRFVAVCLPFSPSLLLFFLPLLRLVLPDIVSSLFGLHPRFIFVSLSLMFSHFSLPFSLSLSLFLSCSLSLCPGLFCMSWSVLPPFSVPPCFYLSVYSPPFLCSFLRGGCVGGGRHSGGRVCNPGGGRRWGMGSVAVVPVAVAPAQVVPEEGCASARSCRWQSSQRSSRCSPRNGVHAGCFFRLCCHSDFRSGRPSGSSVGARFRM